MPAERSRQPARIQLPSRQSLCELRGPDLIVDAGVAGGLAMQQGRRDAGDRDDGDDQDGAQRGWIDAGLPGLGWGNGGRDSHTASLERYGFTLNAESRPSRLVFRLRSSQMHRQAPSNS